jgi:DNA repair exonuclease SbcCD ATPase subunit
MHIPQRWFNAHQNFGIGDTLPFEIHWYNHYFVEGDLLVHLLGSEDAWDEWMNSWLDRLEKEAAKYKIDLRLTTYPAEIEAFWVKDAATEKERQETYWKNWNKVIEIRAEEDRAAERAKEEVIARIKAEAKVGAEAEANAKADKEAEAEVEAEGKDKSTVEAEVEATSKGARGCIEFSTT